MSEEAPNMCFRISNSASSLLSEKVSNWTDTSDDTLNEINEFNWLWPVFEALPMRP